jgi:hypothetical protein
MVRRQLSLWTWRLLMGALLMYCSEVVWWSYDPVAHTATDWIGRAVLYVAFGALVLDLLARFGIGEILGVLTVAGVYGLLNGALVGYNAFTALPMSLVTRPLGLQTLGGGVLGILLLIGLLDGRGFVAWRAGGLALVGLIAGIWVRGFPLLPTNDYPLPDRVTVLVLLAGGWLIIGGLLWLVRRSGSDHDPDAFRLRVWEIVIVAVVLLLAFRAGAAQGAIDGGGSIVLGVMLGYMVIVLLFARGQARQPLLLALNQPISIVNYAIYGGLLVGLAMLGYTLPGTGPDGPLLSALTSILTVFGIAWLPGVSLGLGMRAYVRLMREEG